MGWNVRIEGLLLTQSRHEWNQNPVLFPPCYAESVVELQNIDDLYCKSSHGMLEKLNKTCLMDIFKINLAVIIWVKILFKIILQYK